MPIDGHAKDQFEQHPARSKESRPSSTRVKSELLPDSGGSSPDAVTRKRSCDEASLDGTQDEGHFSGGDIKQEDDSQSQAKKIKKSGQFRRKIKDVISEDKLQSITKEARVSCKM